ncbi:hypothetical protein [Paraburkholderia humisilvae]|uniref:Uncharacterized protein n=1 Tax=Paraburkholderia humisilvae TaxID=627669 RepID=A0A6J5DMB9_9BURK|nr:hypothetical protein [Paraburkholderia humisilvae]CAB3754332.1 hypothetical protein LMG29542_02318 [Paraburkholderia humisilvae]
MESKGSDGHMPGWTLLVGLLGWVVAPIILEACRDFALSWKVGIPAAIVTIIVGAVLERWLDRKYQRTCLSIDESLH